MTIENIHLNYEIISKIIDNNSSILDLGCGEGVLLDKLVTTKNCKGIGIEIDQDQVIKSLEKGLSVIQGNIDEGLKEFQEKQWDWVILNQTLQSTVKPDYVIDEMLRVGKKIIISFPNFAYYKIRLFLMIQGKMPKSKVLPFEWFNTPNIHLLTINDFYEFANERDIKIIDQIFLSKGKEHRILSHRKYLKSIANLLSEEVIFICSKDK